MDPYLVLGLRSDASQADLRRAYRRLARLHHPDHGGSTERMARVNAAYAAVTRGGTGGPHDAAAGSPAQAEPRPSAAPPSPSVRPSACGDPTGGRPPERLGVALAGSPFIGRVAVFASAAVLVRVAAVVLGPPLDAAWFLQLWVAATIAWLAHEELGSLRR